MGRSYVPAIVKEYEVMTMGKNVEIQKKEGKSFLVLENIPSQEALKYINKGDYLATVGSTTRYVISYREFEQSDGFMRITIGLAHAD